jgi:hypothetical protein
MAPVKTALPRFPGRPGRVIRLGLLAIAVAALADAQEQERLELVCLAGDGGVLPLSSATTGAPEEDWGEISAFTDAGVEACWVWTETCPPARRPFGADLAPDCRAGRAGAGAAGPAELVVRLPNAGSEDAAAELSILTAAPAAMWREVPSSLLPSWSVEDDVVRLPHSPGPWRLQVCAEGGCSRWTDVPEGAAEVSPALLPARTASHWIASTDGAPLANTRFYLVRSGQGGFSQTEILGFEQPDEDGRVTFRLPAEETPPVVISSDGLESVAFLAFGDVPARVELGPGLVLSGRVVDGEGAPVDAWLRGHSFIRDGFGLTQMQRGRTGPTGLFRLAGFSAGDATLRAVAAGPDGPEFARRLKLVDSTDLGDIVLAEVEVVWVRVIDSVSRSPVTGAVIRTADDEWRTGEDGLAGLRVRYTRELRVTAPGYDFAMPQLPAAVGRSPAEPFPIELAPALSVTGVFVAADGLTPASNGRLTARGGKNLVLTGVIQPDGAFAVDLPGGAWDLDLVAGNAGSVSLEVVGVGGDTLDLGVVRAPPSAVITGYVLGEAYAPLTGVTVSSTLASEAGPLLAPLLGGTLTATSDKEGYFELHGLAAGPVMVRFEAEGYAPRRLELQVEEAAPMDVGLVELSRGKRVAVLSDAGRGRVEMEVGEAMPPEKMTAALVSGEALFREVPEGPLAIVVLNGDRQPVCARDVPEPKEDLTVRCNDVSVRVTGRVTMGGEPVVGTLLWQREEDGADVPGGFIRSLADGLDRVDSIRSNRIPALRATLNPEGVYRLDSVLPGEWAVTWTPAAGGMQEPRVVDVPDGAGGHVVRDISYQGVSVEGTVLDAEGLPAGRATVEIFPDESPVVSDNAGVFRVLGLQPGRYQLRAREGNLLSDLVEVELDRPGDRRTVELHLLEDRTPDHLRVELVDGSDGFCFAETDNAASGQLVEIGNGVAELRVEPSVGERIRVGCNAGGRWILEGWRSLRQAMEEGLQFDPGASTASLALVGAGPPGGVTIVGPGGWNLGTLRMWFGGGATFSAGETVASLPVGAYVIDWAGGSRSVFTERRRVTEVELTD